MDKYIILGLIIIPLIIYNYKYLLFFQQNRYETKRFLMWFKDKKIDYIEIALIGIFLLSFFVSKNYILIILFLLNFKIIYTNFKIKYIKPLVFTKRVIRQIFTLSLIEILFIYFFIDSKSLVLILNFVWIFILITNFINSPIENIIARIYLNDAKKILKDFDKLTKVAITGSYGKTSTKYIVTNVLKQKFNTYMTPLSYNTPMGITRVVRENLKKIHKFFVCEMGADKKGDIVELMDFINPDIAILTSIGPQHLSTFKTMENIITEKMQLIEKLNPNGIAFINIDNEYIKNYRIINKCKVIKVSLDKKEADIYAFDIKINENGSFFKVNINNEVIDFETKLYGKHNILNCLFAIALAKEIGITTDKIKIGIKTLDYTPHRWEKKNINGYTFIDNAFNSNPISSKMSIDTLNLINKEKIVITPGFIDLGEKEEFYNYEFGSYMANRVDEVYLVGIDKTLSIKKGLIDQGFDSTKIIVFKDVKEAINYVYIHKNKNDVVILLENDLPDAFSK